MQIQEFVVLPESIPFFSCVQAARTNECCWQIKKINLTNFTRGPARVFSNEALGNREWNT